MYNRTLNLNINKKETEQNNIFIILIKDVTFGIANTYVYIMVYTYIFIYTYHISNINAHFTCHPYKAIKNYILFLIRNKNDFEMK